MRNPLLFLVITFTALTLVGSAQIGHAALSDAQIQEAIEQTLSIRHPKDTPQWWKSLGPSTPQVIVSMYQNDQSIYHRIRLLEALAWFPENTQSIELLKKEAGANSNSSLRETAIRSLGRSQGIKAHGFLEKSLQNKNPRVRAAAGEALSEISSASSSRILHQFLSQEKQGWVVKQIQTHRAAIKIKRDESSSGNQLRTGSVNSTQVKSIRHF